MSQTEDHWDEVSQIETEIIRHMIALGLDWHDEAAMTLLAMECKAYHPDNAQTAYKSGDQRLVTKARLFGLVSTMIQTMENAARENREVHGSAVWKAFAKHLYV